MTRRLRGENYTFTVEGSGDFPFDMLRYDACWPYSEAGDSHQLAAPSGVEPLRAGRRIVLQSAQEGGPTAGRWERFGWRVIARCEAREPDLFPSRPKSYPRRQS